jgi:spore coat protein U-like protein
MTRVVPLFAAMLLAAVGAQATPTCTISASLTFGAFNPLPGQSANTTGTVLVTCMGTVGDTANITITITSGNGTFSARKMTSGASIVIYNLYRDSGFTQVWGDSTGGTYSVTDSITLTATSCTKNYVVYGRIATGQNTDTAGNYSDNLLVNLSY